MTEAVETCLWCGKPEAEHAPSQVHLAGTPLETVGRLCPVPGVTSQFWTPPRGSKAVQREDRETYLRTNAPAIVADLEAKTERQRQALGKLNARCAVLKEQRKVATEEATGMRFEQTVAISERDQALAECARLRKLLDRDHTGLATALNEVRRQIGTGPGHGHQPPPVGWGWIPAREWGCYEEQERTEAALRAEVGRCFDAIEAIAAGALRESGDRARAAFQPDKDRIAALEAERDTVREAADFARHKIAGALAKLDGDISFSAQTKLHAAEEKLAAALGLKRTGP